MNMVVQKSATKLFQKLDLTLQYVPVIYMLLMTNGKYYTGMTTNISVRMRYHMNGKTKSTKPYRPHKLVYIEICKSKTDAYSREKKCKKLPPTKKRELIASESNFFKKLL